MRGKKNFFILGGILIIVIIVGFVRFFLINPSTPKATFIMRVNTRSLEPSLKFGSAIEVNKNFSRNDLKEGATVVYKKGDKFAIKRIYKIENGKYYVESNESSEVINMSDIIGVAKKVF
jgi:phage repressor protein C with HTH and peptisase S24 domain